MTLKRCWQVLEWCGVVISNAVSHVESANFYYFSYQTSKCFKISLAVPGVVWCRGQGKIDLVEIPSFYLLLFQSISL